MSTRYVSVRSTLYCYIRIRTRNIIVVTHSHTTRSGKTEITVKVSPSHTSVSAGRSRELTTHLEERINSYSSAGRMDSSYISRSNSYDPVRIHSARSSEAKTRERSGSIGSRTSISSSVHNNRRMLLIAVGIDDITSRKDYYGVGISDTTEYASDLSVETSVSDDEKSY